VFGSRAITGVEDVDFHFIFLTTKFTKGTKKNLCG
jgi:hypothetical protein